MIYKTSIKDITHIFSSTESKLIRDAIARGEKVYAIRLKNLKGLIGFEIQPNRRIGTELADIAKKYGLRGIIHSDELPKYGITEREIYNIISELECDENDAFIILVTKDYEKAKLVFSNIINRINEMIRKVPKDTRQANEDGTTSYLRPQPGSARMYPETDHPLIFVKKYITEEEKTYKIIYEISYGDYKINYEIYKIKDTYDLETLKKIIKERKEVLNLLDPIFIKNLLKKLGYNDKQIEEIIWNEYLYNIIELSFEIDPKTVYYLFYQLNGEVYSLFKEKVDIFDINFVYEIVKYLKDEKIVKTSIPVIYYYYIKGEKNIEKIIKEKNLYKRNKEDLKREIQEFIKNMKDKDKKIIYSEVFKNFKFVANSEDIKEVLDEILK